MQTEKDTHTERDTLIKEETHNPESEIYIHTHTLRERNVNKESETHTERDTQTLRERHIQLIGRDTHIKQHTQTLQKRATTLRQTHNETETHTWRMRHPERHTETL